MQVQPNAREAASLSGTLFSAVEDDLAWYAIRVRSNRERCAAASLEAKGLRCFLPLCRERRNWANRVRIVDRPLIPGYVFSRFNPENRLPILMIPGIVHILGTPAGPLPIDPREIAALQRIVSSPLFAERWPFLSVGQDVSIDAGPLCGLKGKLVAFKSDWRLVVSVTLLQRSVAVVVERDWVRPDR
ncbi:MAG: NusG-like protein [Acidobacteria bacterium]|nr:NusG-like protein [Acidobacteriota bacterium]